MISEIGSNFWEYNLVTNNTTHGLWWEKKELKKEFYKSGRNSIKALCKLVNPNNKVALLPIYTCSTVIEPFIEEGWNVSYYLINNDLSIDNKSLLELCDTLSPSVVLFHSFFGFDTLNNSIDYIKEIKSRNIIIVEDITQSLFSDHCIPFADYYVTSLRKFFAIPDGGFLGSYNNNISFKKDRNDTNIQNVAFEAFDLKKQYFKNDSLEIKNQFRIKYQLLNQMIADNSDILSISEKSLKVLNGINSEEIIHKRRENYCILKTVIDSVPYIKNIITNNMENCTPLYFPIYIENRKLFQSYMAENNVYCPIIWPKSKYINNITDEVEYMYDNMLCIPIDQRYSIEEMNKIIDLILNCNL